MGAVAQIAVGAALMVATTTLHVAVILLSLGLIRARLRRLRPARALRLEVAVFALFVVCLAVLLFSEALLWAVAFQSLGAFSGLAGSLYFTLVTLTTLGYGDLVPAVGFRLMSAFCALTGVLLTGITTAFLIELLRRFALADGVEKP
jgi:hypothetical protein